MKKTTKIFFVFVVIIGLCVMGYALIKPLLRNMIKKKAIEVVTDNNTVKQEDVDKIENILDDTEKETVNNIIDKYAEDMLTTENIENISQKKSIEEVKDYVKSEMSEEDINQVKEIYNNHREEIDKLLENVEINEEDMQELKQHIKEQQK